MKRSAIRIAAVASILIVFALLSGSGSAAGQAMESPTSHVPSYSITLGNRAFSNVQSGAIIAKATRLADGACDNGEMIIDVVGRRVYEGVVSVSADANCTIRLDDVSWRRLATPATLSVAASHDEGSAYTKSELNDEIGIDLLVAHPEIAFSDDGTELENGDFDYDCYVSRWTAWKLTGCSFDSSVHDSDRMWGWTRTQAKWRPELGPVGTTYGKAKVWVWPDERTNHRCYNGRALSVTHWICRYGSS